jgi:hypothetical protein
VSARRIRGVVIAVFATQLMLSPADGDSVLAGSVAQSEQAGGGLALTFTKWVTVAPGYPIMEGVVGGDVDGIFVGEILVRQSTATNDITRLEAVYEVRAGDNSFKALVEGGQNNQAGTALLEGVILDGAHTGARVHVDYRVVSECGQSNALGDTCYTGTIRIAPDVGTSQAETQLDHIASAGQSMAGPTESAQDDVAVTVIFRDSATGREMPMRCHAMRERLGSDDPVIVFDADYARDVTAAFCAST